MCFNFLFKWRQQFRPIILKPFLVCNQLNIEVNTYQTLGLLLERFLSLQGLPNRPVKLQWMNYETLVLIECKERCALGELGLRG